VIAAVAAAIWLLGNPLGLLSSDSGPVPEAPRPPARALPLALAALPARSELPVVPMIPPPVSGSYSIMVGTYDNAREVQMVEAMLELQQQRPYLVDVVMAPDDVQRRVLIGRYASREEAEEARQELGAAFTTARVIFGWAERLRRPDLAVP
jgi:cell division septation protein DedD